MGNAEYMGYLFGIPPVLKKDFLRRKRKASKARMKSALILLSLTMMFVGWAVDAKDLPYDEADQEMETNDPLYWGVGSRGHQTIGGVKGSHAALTCYFTCRIAKEGNCRHLCNV